MDNRQVFAPKLKKTLLNVLGVVYANVKASDGGDFYLTRFAEPNIDHLELSNWYEPEWFNEYKERLKGTGSVHRVPTKEVHGRQLVLVVKNCRVGEDVPVNTHTLKEFCDAEFNSPWEEFSLVMEMREGTYGPRTLKIKTQRPLLIYVPPEPMQQWQSGRSRNKINRIRARHPGIDLDILKEYKMVYEWIEGYNLPEIFENIDVTDDERIKHLRELNARATSDMQDKGYLVADMKPEHVIISESDTRQIVEIDRAPEQLSYLYRLVDSGNYSIVDYELLARTPVHEQAVKDSRRHSYLDDMKNRFQPTGLPVHLNRVEHFGVPYIHGKAESTGGALWVVGENARLFDYFLPERWRKTPSIKLSDMKDVFYTLTKDNIHLVWETSSVGELPGADAADHGINSPFEESALAYELNALGIPCAYVRAIYMTGSAKIETSADYRKFESHRAMLTPDGEPILSESKNYITIRGYYNGPDAWVAEQAGALQRPVDLAKAVLTGLIGQDTCDALIKKVKDRLLNSGYDGGLLKPKDFLLALDPQGKIVTDSTGEPLTVICNFELIWKV